MSKSKTVRRHERSRKVDIAIFERFGILDIRKAFGYTFEDGSFEDCTPFQRFSKYPVTTFYRVEKHTAEEAREMVEAHRRTMASRGGM